MEVTAKNNPSQDQNESPHPAKYRLSLLFLMSTLYFGSSYVYDIPQTLQTQLQSAPLNLDYVQFDALYAVYSIPNIFLPFIGGFMINFIGVNTSTLILTFLVFLGNFLLTIGVVSSSYSTIICGRVIYALGAESLCVAQSMIAVKWFSTKELTLVLGWNNCVCYLGSNLNIVLSPFLYSQTQKLWLPCFIGTVCCLFSFLSAIGYTIVDNIIRKSKDLTITEPKFEEHLPKCKDIKKISIVFWVVSIYYMIFYLSFDGVTTNLNNQIHERFGFTNTQAGGLVLVYYLQLIFVPPIIGQVADTYGKRAHWLIGVSGLCMIAELILGLLPNQAKDGYIVILPLLLLGFSDSIFETVTWSCLLLTLDPNMTAIGYGFATSAMNTVNVIGMLILGDIQDSTINVKGGYYYSQMFLVGVSAVAMAIGIIILVLDKKRTRILETPLPEDKIEQSNSPEHLHLLNQEENNNRANPKDDLTL